MVQKQLKEIEHNGFRPMLKLDGRPKIFYHSSDGDFSEMKGQDSEGYTRKHSLTNRGIYFHEAPPQMQYGKNKYQAYLDIRKPFIIDNRTYVSDVTNPYTGKKIEVEHINAEDIKFLKEQGFDSVMAKYPAFQTVIFEPSQVKLVSKNSQSIKSESMHGEQTKSVVKGFTAADGNKIVDSKGNPIIVYHATNAEFNDFDLNKKGSNTGYDNTIHGIFFSDKKENTDQFGGRVIAAYILMRKPIDLRLRSIFTKKEQAGVIVQILFGQTMKDEDALEFINDEIGLGELYDLRDGLNSDEAHKILSNEGYDGIISDMGNNEKEFIVFDSSQIKQISSSKNNSQESIHENIIISGNKMRNIAKLGGSDNVDKDYALTKVRESKGNNAKNKKGAMRKIKINEHQAKLLKEMKLNKKYRITVEQYNRLIMPIKESVKSKLNEDIFSPELHQAVLKLIHDIYNNPSQAGLDSFWRRNGITWGDLSQFLTGMGLLIALPAGAYKLATKLKGKFFKKPEEAVKAVEDSVVKFMQEPKSGNRFKDPNGQVLMSHPKQEIEEYESNYPPGTENDQSSPWNAQEYPEIAAKIPKNIVFKVIVFNGDIALVKDKSNQLYVFDYADLSHADFEDYANRYEHSDDIYSDFKIDGFVLQNYINDRIEFLPVGEGIKSFNEGDPIVKIDEALKNELINLYDKSKEIVRILSEYFGGVNETTVAGGASTGGSSGPFTAPMSSTSVIKKSLYPEDELGSILKEGPVAGSAANGGSSGPYDANALPGIGREGKFKKIRKTQAQVKTQYPKGSFVEIDNCTKLNNNKEAQNGKCSGGAVDGVVKTKKGSGSVISKE